MSKRKIIKIDQERCNGCGECIPNCPEGALQIIDGKARLVSDLACDGLGACIGHCPQGAIEIEERDAQAYDERKVMESIVRQGENTIKAHLHHLKEHGQCEYLKEAQDFLRERNIPVPGGKEDKKPLPCGCPGTAAKDFGKKEEKTTGAGRQAGEQSQLRQWPIQIMLVPQTAPYLKDADLLIAADCVPFSYADFHRHLLRGRVLLVGCPKLDDADYYKEKITQILMNNNIESITCAHMEVPCCFGMVEIVKEALRESGKEIPYSEVTLSMKGEVLS